MSNTQYVKGGAKLQAALDKIARNLDKAHELRVGVLSGATYPDGTSVAMIAALQNFGTGKIPPRPFFSNMVADKGPSWPSAIATLLKRNDYDAELTLNQMGHVIVGQLQESVIATDSPPLSPITVMLRGMKANNPSLVVTGKTVGEAAARVEAGKTNYGASDKPLVDTGVLLRSFDYEVD